MCVGRRGTVIILHAWGDERIAEMEVHRQTMLDRHEKAVDHKVTRPMGPFPRQAPETLTGGTDGTQGIGGPRGEQAGGPRGPEGSGGSQLPQSEPPPINADEIREITIGSPSDPQPLASSECVD